MPGAAEESREVYLNWVLFCRLKIEAYKNELLALLNGEKDSSIDEEIKTVKQKLNSLWVTNTYLNNFENMFNSTDRLSWVDIPGNVLEKSWNKTDLSLEEQEVKTIMEEILDITHFNEEHLEALSNTHSNVQYSKLTNNWKHAMIITYNATFIYNRDGQLIHPNEALPKISQINLNSLISIDDIDEQELIGFCRRWDS